MTALILTRNDIKSKRKFGGLLMERKTGQIEITKHAMDRLKERVTSFVGYRSWEHLVKTARYEGRNDETMTDEEYSWCSTHIKHLYRSSQVRVLDGFAYIFMGNKGHARTLVTVIAMA